MTEMFSVEPFGRRKYYKDYFHQSFSLLASVSLDQFPSQPE